VKLSAKAEDLARALALISLGVKRNAASAVHIAATDGLISLSSAFMELSIAARAIAMITEQGSAATAAMPLIDLVRSLPPGSDVTISATEKCIAVVAGNHRSRLPLMPWLAMPSMIADADVTGHIEITGAEALTLLEPLPAVSTEPTRYFLCGIFWQSYGDRLGACGTDGVKLIATSIAADFFSGERDLIVPRDGAAVLFRLLKAAKPAMVTLRRSKRLVAASCDRFSFVSKMVDGTYPDIEPVIPPASRNAAIVKVSHLVDALRSLDAVACMTDDSPFLLLNFDGSPKLHIGLARQLEDGSDIIAAETSGIGKAVVQLRIFLNLLGEISGEKVRIEFSDGRPLRISGEGSKLALLSQVRWSFETADQAVGARPGLRPKNMSAEERHDG
jgi:DNA polymerase-3 subunit beta